MKTREDWLSEVAKIRDEHDQRNSERKAFEGVVFGEYFAGPEPREDFRLSFRAGLNQAMDNAGVKTIQMFDNVEYHRDHGYVGIDGYEKAVTYLFEGWYANEKYPVVYCLFRCDPENAITAILCKFMTSNIEMSTDELKGLLCPRGKNRFIVGYDHAIDVFVPEGKIDEYWNDLKAALEEIGFS